MKFVIINNIKYDTFYKLYAINKVLLLDIIKYFLFINRIKIKYFFHEFKQAQSQNLSFSVHF